MINKKGFTLFELMVSVSIIGILMAIASVSFSSAQRKTRDARRMKDMGAISKATETYYSLSNYVYPSNTLPSSWVVPGIGETILAIFPSDPKSIGWTGYVYTGGVTYCACAAMENSSNGNSTNNTCTGFAISGAFYCVKNQQ